MISNITGERGNYSIEVANCNNIKKTTEIISDNAPLVPFIQNLAEVGSRFFYDNILK